MIDINKAKQKILDLAIRGKLTKQLKSDGNAADLLFEIQKEKEKQNIRARKTHPYTVVASCASPNTNNDSEMPFEIPDSWVWCKLDQISKVVSKGTTPRGGKVAYKNSGIGFLRAENILGFNRIETYNLKYIEEKIHNSILKRSILFENDILISIAGTLGRTGLVTKELLPLNTNQAICFIRLINDKEIIPKYILYVLNSNSVKLILMNKKVDMAIPNISLETISNCPIPLPPLAEQNRIVEIVDKLFDTLDKIDEAQKKYQKDKEILKSKIIEAGIRGKLTKQLKTDGNASDLLDEIRKEKEKLIKEGKIKQDKKETYIYKKSTDNLYYEKFHDGTEKCINDELPFEIPDNWSYAKLISVCDISTGTSIAKDVKQNKYSGLDKGYCYIGTKDVETNHDIVYENGIKIPYDEKGFEIAPKGSVLLCIEGGSAGKKIAIVDRDVYYGNKLCKFYSHYLNSKYIFYYLRSNMFKNIFKNNLTGLIDGVSINTICNLLIPIPSILVQEKIVKQIEELLDSLDS